MKRSQVRAIGGVVLCWFALAAAVAGDEKADKKKTKIDQMAQATLKRLFAENPKIKPLYERSYGYAVFDARQTKIMVAGGGGDGVAIERSTGEKTYMKQATLGVGVGLGIQVYQVVFLFEGREGFDNFVEKGWEVSAGANAAAGDEGKNAGASATGKNTATAGADTAVGFSNGMAVFQMTEKGLMLQADISGTKYWKPEGLNEP
jgi:lipid-binding SYLF domain-containing protein